MDIKQFILKILDSINEIYNSKKKLDTLDISLMNGITGLALANFVVGKKTKNNDYIFNARSIMEDILKRINEENYKLRNVSSYCNGFAGVCEVLNLFWKEEILDIDLNEDLEEFYDFLYKGAIVMFENNNPDFLHGAMGILYHFSNIYDRNPLKMRDFIDGMINKYEKMSIVDEKGARIFNSILLDQEKNEINFSLSHGLSGHVIIFSEIYKKYKSSNILNLTERIEKYISSYRKEPLSSNNIFNTYYPTFVVENQPILENKKSAGYDSRLAWCYGELNYALMYFKLYEILKKRNYYYKAKEVLKNTVVRNNPKDAKISSPFFCHGASGLIALNMVFFRKTSDMKYKEIADYWFKYIKEFFEKESIYKAIENDPFGLLEGGVGLVLGLASLIDNGSYLKYVSTKEIYENLLLLN